MFESCDYVVVQHVVYTLCTCVYAVDAYEIMHVRVGDLAEEASSNKKHGLL